MRSISVVSIFVCVFFMSSIRAEYIEINDGYSDSYIKKNDSGCTTKVTFPKDDLVVKLSYFDCDNVGNLGSVDDFATNILDIIEKFELIVWVREKQVVLVNFFWNISHYPVYLSINNKDSWPVDFSSVEDVYECDEICFKNHLKSVIASETAYKPILTMFNNLSCSIELSSDYVDPLYYTSKVVSRLDIINWGVIEKKHINKDIYPLIKGWVSFDVDCSDKNAKEG